MLGDVRSAQRTRFNLSATITSSKSQFWFIAWLGFIVLDLITGQRLMR